MNWGNFKQRLKRVLFVFTGNKPHLRAYYFSKMTSMYSTNFKIALWIVIAYKIMVELLFLLEVRLYSYKMLPRLIRLTMVFVYGGLANDFFLKKKIDHAKTLLLLIITAELLMTAGITAYYSNFVKTGNAVLLAGNV